MNRAAFFGSYSYESNDISIDGSLVTKQDVGTYSIVFIAEFTKDE